MKIELWIETSSGIVEPVVLDGIQWTTERRGAPSTLKFTVVKDHMISFTEGNKVGLRVNGTPLFFGYIFEKGRDRDHQITVTAYDQLRYLKNKETYLLTNKRADELVTMIASDFKLSTGTIENTGFKIAKIDEDNSTLFDVILNALDLTYDATKKMYVLYDDFGKLTLKLMDNLKVDGLIDDSNTENFDYTSSIDKDSYNQIKVRQQNATTGKMDVYRVNDNVSIGKWGVLQFTMDVGDGTNPISMANTLLKVKNRKTRSLTLKGVRGDIRVRAGFSIPVHLNLGDIENREWLVCEKVTHNFFDGYHTMDIDIYDKWEK